MDILFLISLPRSGSTLLNRLLSSHSSIASHSEPWLMLPLVHMTRENSINAYYSHQASSRAIRELADSLDSSAKKWNQHIRDFASAIYLQLAENKSKKNAKYFLDKTPRYHLIIKSLKEIFPSAKFLILVRNPLSCLASGIQTWGKGKLILHGQAIDLYEGPKNIAGAIMDLGDSKLKIKYEDLISDPRETISQILDFLDLPFEPLHEMLGASQLRGKMGDPTGVKKYGNAISSEPLTKFAKILGTTYRKRFALNYIKTIDPNHLQVLGYPKEELITTIRNIPSKNHPFVSDMLTHNIDEIWRYLDLSYFRDRFKDKHAGKRSYVRN